MKIRKFTEIPNSAPAAGPYSPAISVEGGKLLFISGQVPYDPIEKKIVRENIAQQTELVLQSIKRVVEAAGGSIENIVNCRVYLQPLNAETFHAMNTVYGQFFGLHKPTRTTIGAGLLNMDVEMDAVAVLP